MESLYIVPVTPSVIVWYRTRQPRSCNRYFNSECCAFFSSCLAAAKPSRTYPSSRMIFFYFFIHSLAGAHRSIGHMTAWTQQKSRCRVEMISRKRRIATGSPENFRIKSHIFLWRSSHMRPLGLEVAEVSSRSTVSRNACLVRGRSGTSKPAKRRQEPTCKIYVQFM